MNEPFLELFSVIENRKKIKSKKSYTSQLFREGEKKIAQKFGEESVELIIDYLKGPKKRKSVSQEEFERLVGRIMEMLEDSSYPRRKLARSKTTLRRLISRGNPDEGEYENLMGIFKAIKEGKR